MSWRSESECLTDRVTDYDDKMGGGGKKKRKSNSRKGVPPTPEDKKPEVKRYEILKEARHLLSPSPTPSAAGSRFGALGDEGRDRIDNMAIIVSEDEGDKVDPVDKSGSTAPKFVINLPPSTFRSSADKELIEGLMRELEEVEEGVRQHLGPGGLIGGLEKEIAIMAKENNDLKRAVLVAEAEAARVKKMHSNHEGFWERKLTGLEESLDLVCKGKERVEKELVEGVQKYTEVYRMDLEKQLRKEMEEEEKKRLQKRKEKSKDKGVQWQTTTVPVKVEVRECEVQTDTVPDLTPLPRRTYADVATQAQANVMGSEHPKELSGIKDKDFSPASFVGMKGGGDSRGCMTHAVVVHGVSYWQGMGDIIAGARSMKLGGSRRLLGARWLVSWKRRLRKKVSLVVLFFNGNVPLRKPGVWFVGRLCLVERYEFDHGLRS